jgi:murein DD-endopeptidase MepM/ murein hydrolase activator NlpD
LLDCSIARPFGRSIVRAVACSVLAAACAKHSPPRTTPSPAPEARRALDDHSYLELEMLMVPVAGVRPSQVPDSYNDARQGGRVHHAVDILAPRGTPVLSADDGRVLRMRRNTLGGITIYAIDPADRFVYYYAHLERYARNLAEGQTVSKGEVLGYVGTTGDAPANTPHLHFQLMRRPNAARWWDGEPIDPKPYLQLPGRAASDAGSAHKAP